MNSYLFRLLTLITIDQAYQIPIDPLKVMIIKKTISRDDVAIKLVEVVVVINKVFD